MGMVGFAGLWFCKQLRDHDGLLDTVPRWIGWTLIVIALALASIILLIMLGIAVTTLFHS